MSQQIDVREQRRIKSKHSGFNAAGPTLGAKRARRKFLRFFPKGFQDQTYIDWERGYKWDAHEQWDEVLTRRRFRAQLKAGDFQQIAAHAVRIESRTNLLFSFE